MNGTGNDCLEIKADYLENLTSWFSSIGGSKSPLHFCLWRFEVTFVCYLPWFPCFFWKKKTFCNLSTIYAAESKNRKIMSFEQSCYRSLHAWVPFSCCKVILWELSYDNNNNSNNNNNNNNKFHSTQFNFHFITSTSKGNVKQNFEQKLQNSPHNGFLCLSFSCNFIGYFKQALKSGWLFCFSVPFSLAVYSAMATSRVWR